VEVLRRMIGLGSNLISGLKLRLRSRPSSRPSSRPRWSIGQRHLPASLLNLALVGLLAWVLLSAWVPTANGKASLLRIWQQPDRSIERLGNVEVTPVQFEGARLFTVAAPTVWDRSKPIQQLPVELRARQVEANLNRVIAGGFLESAKDGILTNFDPKTLQVSVVSLNDVPMIVANDSYHSQPLKLVTVTYIDADYNAQPAAELAEQWRSLIYQSLYTALQERSPDALSLRGKLGESLLVLAVMLGASLVIWLLQLPLYRRNRRLRMQQTTLTAAYRSAEYRSAEYRSAEYRSAEHLPSAQPETNPESELMARRRQFLALFEQLQPLQRQRQVVGFFRWLLAWGQGAVWLAGLSLALGLFPWTKPYLPRLNLPVTLLAIWLGTALSNRLTSIMLQEIVKTWIKFGASSHEPQRDELRGFTLLSALQPLKSFGIYMAGLIAALVYLGLPLSLVLSLGGVVGLAVLLVCQGLVRDWVMGLLIFWEDQYVIGDVVAVAGEVGLVERMNLRLTQIQTAAGGLISIANGSLSRIENLTQSWLYRETQNSAHKPHLNPFGSVVDSFGADSTEPTATEG
jgi:moderate conductance mechanosensitive channel